MAPKSANLASFLPITQDSGDDVRALAEMRPDDGDTVMSPERSSVPGRAEKTFTASVTQEGALFVAQCREIDVASQGESEAEALANLREALELWFEGEPEAPAAIHVRADETVQEHRQMRTTWMVQSRTAGMPTLFVHANGAELERVGVRQWQLSFAGQHRTYSARSAPIDAAERAIEEIAQQTFGRAAT